MRSILWLTGGPVRATLLIGIWVYQRTLGSIFGGQCRFTPTCSEYARQAIRDLGAIRGSALAGWRILRCSPLSRGGVDPPPRPSSYDHVIRRGAVRPAQASPGANR